MIDPSARPIATPPSSAVQSPRAPPAQPPPLPSEDLLETAPTPSQEKKTWPARSQSVPSLLCSARPSVIFPDRDVCPCYSSSSCSPYRPLGPMPRRIHHPV